MTLVPRPGAESMSKASMSRLAPMMPRPMPVEDWYRPLRIVSSPAMPGPRSQTRMVKIWGRVWPSTEKSIRPPPP